MNDRKCPDCGVEVGQIHQPGCDIEPCPECGGQRMFGCCDTELPAVTWKGDCELRIAAKELDFYCYEDPAGWGKPEMNYGWIICDKNHPEAHPDLNRIAKDCKWDKQQQKWVKK